MSLQGFENITYDLLDEEMAVVPLFVKGFKSHVGKKNAITNDEILAKMKLNYPFLNQARVRKIINYIRTSGLCPGLAASSNGYYVTDDPEDIRRYIKSLDGRENEIKRVKNSMIRYLKEIET